MKPYTAVIILYSICIFNSLYALELENAFGKWESDLEITRQENSLLSEKLLNPMMEDLRKVPITLTIDKETLSTDTYIKTATEKYSVVENLENRISIEYAPKENDQGKRGAKITIRGDILLLQPNGATFYVAFRKKKK